MNLLDSLDRSKVVKPVEGEPRLLVVGGGDSPLLLPLSLPPLARLPSLLLLLLLPPLFSTCTCTQRNPTPLEPSKFSPATQLILWTRTRRCIFMLDQFFLYGLQSVLVYFISTMLYFCRICRDKLIFYVFYLNIFNCVVVHIRDSDNET